MQLTHYKPSYQRTILYKTDAFEIVSCTWVADDFSPLHDHRYSQCYTLIEEGRFENITDFGNKKEAAIKESGQTLVTPIGAKHEIRCLSTTGKTFHVYSPKISELQQAHHFDQKSALEIKSLLDLQITNSGISFEKLMTLLDSVAENSVATNSVYFMNQLFSGTSSQMLAAENLIAKSKATMATYEASPVLTTIETEVVQALCQQIGWSKDFSEGIAVPGGSNANFMALHCARQDKFPDYKQKGLPQVSLKVFCTAEAHYSLKKACIILGLGLEALVTVKTDNLGRMDAADLNLKLEQSKLANEVPLIVYATAGTTVFGAFDPIAEMAAVCKKQNVWLHVDAAWGGPALFSRQTKNLFQGVEQADSFTFDAHKFYGAGMTCAFFLTQHPNILFEANDVAGGDYIFHDSEAVDRGRISWQCGRRADAVGLWTLWKSLGTDGMASMIDSSLNLKNELLPWIKTQPRLQLVTQPDFLNICVKVLPATDGHDEKDWSVHVRNELKRKDQAMVNYSTLPDGTAFLRLIIANPFLQLADLKNILTWAQEVQ